MVNGNFISLKKILWRVFNHPTTEELNFEDAAEYAIEAIKLIGAPLSFVDKVTVPPLEIVNYKAALPPCILNIRGVKLLGETRSLDVALRRATDIYHAAIPCNDSGFDADGLATDLPTTPYDDSNQGVNADLTATGERDNRDQYHEFTYTAQGGVIQTSFKTGSVEVSYKSIATDEEGYPLIPDTQEVKLALEYYILFRFFEPIWLLGKMSDKAFQYIDQKKCWYLASANTAMQLAGGDHLESVMNSINRLIINDQAFSNFYKGSGEKERIKKYN
ncbi:MAG: hypothetical protein KUG81_02680 [Gammaproteobacteria bacterium]|nr:hypothetical protein [Gammaproteobacteria bacterium]